MTCHAVQEEQEQTCPTSARRPSSPPFFLGQLDEIGTAKCFGAASLIHSSMVNRQSLWSLSARSKTLCFALP